MRVELSTNYWLDEVDELKVGDRLSLVAMVDQIEVQTIDVTSGRGRQIIAGERTIRLVIETIEHEVTS